MCRLVLKKGMMLYMLAHHQDYTVNSSVPETFDPAPVHTGERKQWLNVEHCSRVPEAPYQDRRISYASTFYLEWLWVSQFLIMAIRLVLGNHPMDRRHVPTIPNAIHNWNGSQIDVEIDSQYRAWPNSFWAKLQSSFAAPTILYIDEDMQGRAGHPSVDTHSVSSPLSVLPLANLDLDYISI